ncbi:MAG: TetR/AcrR family transcriptional regulator [Bacillota bacterium]|jgi:AcrR family transcriptional regulator
MQNTSRNSAKTNIAQLTDKGLRSYQRIIDIGINMIRTRGYSETSIQDICTEVGIGIGTFYHYFRSKEEMLLAFIDEENKNLLNYYNQCDKSSYGNAMISVAEYYADMYLFKGVDLISHVYSMLLFSTINIGDLNENAFHQILQDAFIQGQQKGEFSQTITVDAFCNIMLGEWFYSTSLWCNDPHAYNLHEMVIDSFTQILKLVSVSRPSSV